ncbi:hypothetical protein [uncultured Sphingomonas sp.]|uniref:hypothetical protein n=1 Tax=uncultured Sphingomonas sp. TaxID=158754 RepID=UPI0034257EF5
MNLIVGINGVGKTTLLNVVFRMLVGPYDPAKGDRIRPGRKQATVIRSTNFDFFRRRAADDAMSATASATFKFGDRTIRIERSLKDLALIGYSLDGHETLATIDPVATDEALMDVLATLMGFNVSSAKTRESSSYRYDFDFVVRNLIFFLEDKVPLIWNPDGQFVILRILLVDEELSEAISAARNDLLRADSQYRNRLWVLNKDRDEFASRLADLPEPTSEGEQLGLVVSEVANLESARDDLHAQRSYFNREMDDLENAALRARAEAFDAQTVLRREEAAYFQQAFLEVRSPGDLILQALQSHEGCLVCGNTEKSAYDRARALMERHQCPVCEADTSFPENVPALGDAILERLHAAEAKAKTARQTTMSIDQRSSEVREAYQKANADLLDATARLDKARRRRDQLSTLAERSRLALELQAKLEGIEAEVLSLRSDLDAHVQRHDDLVQRSQEYVQRRSDAIIEAFESYAASFMVEDCELRYRSDRKGKVAQSDEQIDWPAFEVYLASGAEGSPTERVDADAVSESQKEFIDLAFRMALLRVASERRPSMLVVETPEASLDAFFVGKAGALLRDYASADPDNVLLASSNLTREEMIAQLLGTTENLETTEIRRARALNLLNVARETKAYRLNKKFYDDRFEDAVAGSPPAPEPSAPGGDE